MAYYQVRFYSGSGEQPPEQLLKEVVEPQLLPQLREAGGLLRYTTFIADDGRIGSASVYENKEAAERGSELAKRIVGITEALKGYQPTGTLEGEIADYLDADIRYEPAFGMGRLFTTDSTAAEVVESIKKARDAATYDEAGRVRTVIAQLDGGRVGSFSAYDTVERRDRHTAAISKARESEDQKRVLPNDPELISVRIITATS